jgi:ankyrin repeat protein
MCIYFNFYFYVKNGRTALMLASQQGDFKIVNLLIENNADLNIQDDVFFFLNFFLYLRKYYIVFNLIFYFFYFFN